MYYTSKEQWREMHERRLASSANKGGTTKVKRVMKKFVIYTLRLVWIVVGAALAMGVLYVTAVVLAEVIPAGTSFWVRLAIGVPFIFAMPIGATLLYVAITKRIDRRMKHSIF